MNRQGAVINRPLSEITRAEQLLPTRRSVMVVSGVLLALLTLGFVLDAPVARFLHTHGHAHWFDQWSLKWVAKAPGEAWLVAIVCVLLGLLHPWRWRAAGFVALAAALSGLHAIGKFVVGRTRPFKLGDDPNLLLPFTLDPFRGGLAGFFDHRNLAFPSGHASTAFAFAAAMGVVLPRYRPWFYLLACLTAAQRVSENAHYVSDVVGGAIVGVGVTYGSLWCITRIQNRHPPAPTRTP